MASARASTGKINEKLGNEWSLGKKAYNFGGICIWLNKKPESADELYQLALEIQKSSWGNNHLLQDSSQSDALVLEMMKIAAQNQNKDAANWLKNPNRRLRMKQTLPALIEESLDSQDSPPSDLRMVSPSAKSDVSAESKDGMEISVSRAQTASPGPG